MEVRFRALRADEVECRVGTVSKEGKGLSLLLYKDARVDMAMLDEVAGPLNWTRAHSRDNKNCIVSIWDDAKSSWVSKEDTGTESRTEAEKGLASDSFKRACVNWGIGRELYTAPFIWIRPEQGGKFDRYVVDSMEVEDGRITALAIRNTKTNQVVYTYGMRGRGGPAKAKAPVAEPAGDHLQPVRELVGRYAEACGVSVRQASEELPGAVGAASMRDVRAEDVPRLLEIMRRAIEIGGAE